MVEEVSGAFQQLAIDTITALVERGVPTINADGSVELPEERRIAHFNVDTGEITAGTRRLLQRRLQRQMDDAQSELRAQWIAAGEEPATSTRGPSESIEEDGEPPEGERREDHRDESRWNSPEHVIERERPAVTVGRNGISVWRSPEHIVARRGRHQGERPPAGEDEPAITANEANTPTTPAEDQAHVGYLDAAPGELPAEEQLRLETLVDEQLDNLRAELQHQPQAEGEDSGGTV
eukprot:GHVU01049063.1.p1 GENE.GHVU01049063.1~~GHVU01049063.1.p1  ORF type:complete len:259 (+),score=49.97 GHVU01049063.1:71-778(+)